MKQYTNEDSILFGNIHHNTKPAPLQETDFVFWSVIISGLKKEKVQISGKLIVMDVVNSLITSDAEKYCTMLYAKISETE